MRIALTAAVAVVIARSVIAQPLADGQHAALPPAPPAPIPNNILFDANRQPLLVLKDEETCDDVRLALAQHLLSAYCGHYAPAPAQPAAPPAVPQ